MSNVCKMKWFQLTNGQSFQIYFDGLVCEFYWGKTAHSI